MTESSTRDQQVRAALHRAARDLTGTSPAAELDDALHRIVRAAVDMVPAADGGGITLVDGHSVDSRAPTDSTVADLDKLQSTMHEGPCITAASSTATLLVHDLAGPDAERWPMFAARAVGVGYRSMLSTHIATTARWRVSLNLYSAAPDAFDADAHRLAELFSAQAVIGVEGIEGAAAMTRALESRDVIGQAKGILMERFGVDDDAAFAMLVRSSQDTNVKLVNVARWLREQARQPRESGEQSV